MDDRYHVRNGRVVDVADVVDAHAQLARCLGRAAERKIDLRSVCQELQAAAGGGGVEYAEAQSNADGVDRRERGDRRGHRTWTMNGEVIAIAISKADGALRDRAVECLGKRAGAGG